MMNKILKILSIQLLEYERSQRELEIQIHHKFLAAIHEELQWKFCSWWDEQNERSWKTTIVNLEGRVAPSGHSCYLRTQMVLQSQ